MIRLLVNRVARCLARVLLRCSNMSRTDVASSAITAAALLATGAWLAYQPSLATIEAERPIMRADAVSRVATDRQRSVVLLHSLTGSPSGQSQAQRGLFTEPIREGIGSGIVIDGRGLILTNAHVVESVGVIHVRRPDGTDVATSVVGSDPEADLALLRASDATGLTPAVLGDSDRIAVGSYVVAIGSPLGLHHTVTAGVLSATGRTMDASGVEFLQTDAAVNPGSSGGALFDLSGHVIGVLTAVLSTGGENVGLNFAIPINTVKGLLPALQENRSVHGWLGITTLRLTSAGAKAFGLGRADEGLLVAGVAGAGPAAAAGVQVRDIVLGMAGNPPVAAPDVNRRVWYMAPGSSVRLRLLRDGQPIELPVTLGQRPAAK